MKNIITKLLLVFFLASILTSCVNTIYPIRIPSKSPKIPENSIEKDIPRYPNNKVFAFYKFAKQKQEQLNLSVPEEGYDSLMVRVWFSYPQGIYQLGEMVEFKFKSDSLPVIRYTKMELFYNPSREYEVVNYHNDSIISQPLSGWAVFMDSFQKSDITTLPTIERIPSYISLTGNGVDYANSSMTVSVEVSQKDTYRFYQYNNLEKYRLIEEVNKIYGFVKFIRTDLNLMRIDPNWYKE